MRTGGLEASLVDRARRLGIVVYEHRLIYDARPPITDDVFAKIEKHCRGPLPEGLKDLWRVSFGGSLDYDLETMIGDSVVAFSFTELFYPGSHGYRDLWGWVEHEVELAEQAADERGLAFDGRLTHLPIGGFEYTDRLYVCVEPGPEHGSVHGWMHGLPPAWVLRLNEDTVGRIADDISGLFRMLDLANDPFEGDRERFEAGGEMAALIEQASGEDAQLGEALRKIVGSAIADWRSSVIDRSISTKARHRRLAMTHAVECDDRALLLELASLGCSFNEGLRPQGNALDLALVLGKIDLADFFLQRGVSVTNAVRNGANTAPPDLVRRLLDAGSRPTGVAATSAARAGLYESAVLIAAALQPEERAELVATLNPDQAQEKWKAIEMLRDACLAMNGKRQ